MPAVLDGLCDQTRPPDRVVAVDTGSTDESPRCCARTSVTGAVHSTDAGSSYGAAVAYGLAVLAEPADPDDWVWLLHDDSAPAPDALEQLLAVAAAPRPPTSSAPSSASGPRCAGCSRSASRSAAPAAARPAWSAASTTRASTTGSATCWRSTPPGCWSAAPCWRPSGFDEQLPLFGNDVDFGWRAARAGHRTVVVPDAVVFHVEAAHRGVREHQVKPSGYRRGERSAALYTLLVNGSAWALPFMVVRLFLGSLVRAVGLLLVRAPGEAVDELAGLVATYLRPWRILAGRRRRRRSSTVPHRQVRPLLAPPWMPYRHGLDFLSDLTTAVVLQAGDLTAARRARTAAAAETGPVSEDAQNLPEDTGLLARLVTSPVAWVFAVLVVAAARRRPRPGRRRVPVRRRAAPGPAQRARLVAPAPLLLARPRHRLGRARRAVRPAARGRRHPAARQGLAARRRAVPARRAAGGARRLPLPAAGSPPRCR